MSDVPELRRQLALLHQVCAHFGLNEGVCNHLSVKVDGRDEFLLLKYGVHWSRATAADVVVLDYEGNVLQGSGRPEPTGFFSHRALHKTLGEGATAVLHTHMPFATALMCLKEDCGGRLLPVHQNFLRFRGYDAYEDTWGGFFDDAVSDVTASVAKQWVDAHDGRCPRIMLSANHGAFAFGHSITDAWDNLYYLERLCEVQVRALSCAGGDISRLRMMPEKAMEVGAQQEQEAREASVAAHWRAMSDLMADRKPRYDEGL